MAATVSVDGREVGRCGNGLMVLVGVHRNDTLAEAKKLATKLANLRIFGDSEGKMNLSILDRVNAGDDCDMLAVSNFTVYGESKNRRPSFMDSAGFEKGSELFEAFVISVRELGVDVQTGIFGANMLVSLVNDGPVTLIVDVDA